MNMTYWKQLISLFSHKWYVFRAGIKIGKIPIWRLIIHDWSKFTPTEFFRYANYKFGDGTNQDWATGWLHHLHTSPHHPEHWVLSWHGNPDFYSNIGKDIAKYITVLPMPEMFAREMLADMHGTSKQVTGNWDISIWLNENGPKMFLHDETIIVINKIMKEIGYVLVDNSDWSWVNLSGPHHCNDPCVYCNKKHDEVGIGPCTGRSNKDSGIRPKGG